MQDVDVAAIGSGPAGLTAGIYLGRARFNAVLFEKSLAGGQMAISEWIENFPGFGDGISGAELAAKMRRQAVNCGARLIEEEVTQITAQDDKKGQKNFLLQTAEGKDYRALAVIVASGAQPKKLGVPGEDAFAGRGVSYCATCDAPLFKEKEVVVVGGGDTAVQEALFLAKFAKKVYLVHRRDRLRATKILAERVESCKKIEPLWNSVVTEIAGEKKVKAAGLRDVKTNASRFINCDGVFIFAGILPNSDFMKGLVKQDSQGYIITDEDMRTSCEGVFACGDVRRKLLRQIATACGEAATAAISAQDYVQRLKGTAYV